MSAKCDACGKEISETYAHYQRIGYNLRTFCPDCWDEFLHPKNFSDVINLDPMQVNTFNKGLEAGIKMAEDKDKQAMIDALNRIGNELHELNKNFNLRDPFNISQKGMEKRVRCRINGDN